MIELLIFGAIAIFSGSAASKTVAVVREIVDEEDVIQAKCCRCKASGPHKFLEIERGVAGDAIAGLLLGGIGGGVKGLTAAKIFKCSNCSAKIYKDGSRVSGTLDDNFCAFVSGPALKRAYEDLEYQVAIHTDVAKRHHQEISEVKEELANSKADQEQLLAKMERLIRQIQCEGEAA